MFKKILIKYLLIINMANILTQFPSIDGSVLQFNLGDVLLSNNISSNSSSMGVTDQLADNSIPNDWNNFLYGMVLEPDSVSIYKFFNYPSKITSSSDGLYLFSLTGNIQGTSGGTVQNLQPSSDGTNIDINFSDGTSQTLFSSQNIPTGGNMFDHIALLPNYNSTVSGETYNNYVQAFMSSQGSNPIYYTQLPQS